MATQDNASRDPGTGAGAGRDAGSGGGPRPEGAQRADGTYAPPVRKANWKSIGPGIVVAATGVGAGDLVATLIAGSKFGYTLLWAAVIGAIVKIALAEATGRWHLATGRTLFHGWRTLGSWTTVYFGIYVVIWGFVYGATAMSASGLPLAALFPDTLGLRGWAVLSGLTGLVFVWFNRYAVFEKVMTVLIGVMFVVVVYLAVRVSPNLGDAVGGLVPVLPDGSLLYTLGLIGGVGGTITMAAYGYWVNAKGWTDSSWMKMMRLDNRVAYITTGIFVVAMLIVGAELLSAGHVSITEGDKGLVDLGRILEDRFGAFTANLFLVGFFAASFSSLIGVWQGVSLMFADFTERLRAARVVKAKIAAGKDGEAEGDGRTADVSSATAEADLSTDAVARGERERSLPYKAYLLWLTFPPMTLLFLDQPFALVVGYGVLGAFFMPFLALTLVWLLNSDRTPREWRNGMLSNVLLIASGLLFLVLCVQQIVDVV